MKKGSSGSPSRCPNLNQVRWPLLSSQTLKPPSVLCDGFRPQVNPDRRRLRRGETVEVSSPSAGGDAGPRLTERPQGRCHTLDSGEETAEQPESTNTCENTLTGVAQTPKPAPHPEPDAGETHGAATPTPPHADRPSASHEPGSHSPRPLNGDHTPNEALQSEGDGPPGPPEANGETPAEQQEAAAEIQQH